jgi:transposase-like protein
MTAKKKRTYTEKFKSEVVEHYRAHGAHKTVEVYKVARSAVYRWAKEAGIDATQDGKARTETATLANAAKRAELRVKMLALALELLAKVRNAGNSSADSKNYMWCLAVAIDKVRLDAGEATEIHEDITLSDVDAKIARLERQFSDS